MNFKNLAYTSVISALLSVSSPAIAQTIVGTAIVDGKKVEILSNNTWRFEGAAAAQCQDLSMGLSFCGDKNVWKWTQPPNEATAAQYHYDDRHYGQFIVEGLGSDDGMTHEFMRDAVINNGATATGVQPSEIPVLDVIQSEIDGNPSETVVYGMNFDGLDVVFSNTITILPKRSFQSIVFAIGTEYSARHKELKAELMSLTKIKDN